MFLFLESWGIDMISTGYLVDLLPRSTILLFVTAEKVFDKFDVL